MDIQQAAFEWVSQNKAINPREEWYCAARDVFSARLSTLLSKLERLIRDDAYLLTAVIGEIGNNSFDHNLGNWPDIPGVFFAYAQDQKTVVLADRGQGILKTIQRIKPGVKTYTDALLVAFTEIISGRSPERRGNGLKFVSKTVREKHWSLMFKSGNATLSINSQNPLTTKQEDITIRGCFAVIKYG